MQKKLNTAFDLVKVKEEREEEEIQKRFALVLEHLCKEFERCMSANIREKKFVWRNIHQIEARYLSRFIEKLKETFIGCDIIVDPLKTYIIIDWS